MSEATEQFLVPTATLEAMLKGIRLLRRRSSTRPGSRKQVSAGPEAVWTAVLLALRGGDLVSVAPELLADEQVTRLAHVMAIGHAPLLLQRVGTTEEARLGGVLGAAAALKAQGKQGIVVALAERKAMRDPSWRRVLAAAGNGDLPVVFAIAPEPRAEALGNRLSAWSQQAGGAEGRGVPGMPVDAADAVALCRVLQESTLRARTGDGPALLEAVWWRLNGRRHGAERDAVTRLQATLRARARKARGL